MSAYKSVILGEKTPIVFDFGAAYLKFGFAGEANPRFILPSPFGSMDFKKENLREILKELFHRLCYRYLFVDPNDRRMVIVESIISSTYFKETIGEVLFMHFEVPSILFAPAHVVSLFTLGINTGLVLDCGYTEAIVLPVFEGFTLLSSWQSSPLGSKHIHERLESQIRESGFLLDQVSQEKKPISEIAGLHLPESLLEDVKVRACFVTTSERARKLWRPENHDTKDEGYVEASFACSLGNKHGGQSLHIPSRIRETGVEDLFTGDEDNITLQTLILDAILQAPIDCRRPLIENLVCIGGTAALPGFLQRLNEELKATLDLPKYSTLVALKQHIKFHSPPSKPNFTAWLGGAIFGALESLPGRSVSRKTYLETRNLPDWSTIVDVDTSAEPLVGASGDEMMHAR